MEKRISNCDDTIDSRDVIARIQELEAIEERSEDEQDELDILNALADQGQAAPDWEDGATLIWEQYFDDYAQELAEELGYIENDMSWPYSCIDWRKASDELKMDYFSVDFDGAEYWIRA